jgi:hypothetical protein
MNLKKNKVIQRILKKYLHTKTFFFVTFHSQGTKNVPNYCLGPSMRDCRTEVSITTSM